MRNMGIGTVTESATPTVEGCFIGRRYIVFTDVQISLGIFPETDPHTQVTAGEYCERTFTMVFQYEYMWKISPLMSATWKHTSLRALLKKTGMQ